MEAQRKEHKCFEINLSVYKDFQAKHKNLYLPNIVQVFHDSGEWILATADEYAIPIKFCPHCGIELK